MYGFIPGRSAVDCLQNISHHVQSFRSQKKWVTLLSLDIKGAYDGVWVQGLIDKLEIAGLEKNLLFLIQDFIFNQPVQIKWRGVNSNGTHISCLPQGSIISPFLFNVYMQDLFKELPPNVYPFVYADDISIIIPGSSPENCILNIHPWKVRPVVFKVEGSFRSW